MTNKEAIEIVKTFRQAMDTPITEHREILLGALDMAIEALEERPQGEWIKKVDDVGFISHICSNCGSEIEVEDPCDDKFCYSCGAKMKGGEEE